MDDQSGGKGPREADRELKDSRDREASYRARLASTANRLRELREVTTAILEVLRRTPPRKADLTRTLTEVAALSKGVLGVDRASIWMLDEAAGELRCTLQLSGEGNLESEPALKSADSPAYFRALSGAGVVAIADARQDLRTAGLEPYLERHGVSALLDISVVIPGEIVGVVCHEHTGGPRDWQPEEIDFATHVGNLVALAIEGERREVAQTRVASAEARYRYLVESLPVTVYSFDAFSSNLEYLSPQFQEFGLYTPEVALQKGVAAWLAVVHPEDRKQVEARFAPGGVDKAPAEITYRIVLPDGQTRYVRDHCRVVRSHTGDPMAIQGVLADVTEQRKSEQRAQELERRLRSLLENVDLLGVVLDRDGRLEFVNAEFEKVTGYRSSDVIGVDGFELLVAPAEVKSTRDRFLRDLRDGSLGSHFENEILTRTGERRHIMWTNTLLRGEDGSATGCCTLGLDVTDRVRLEADLMQQSKMESLGQLSAGVAHDFNNLLTVLMYGTETLARPTTPDIQAATVDLMRKALAQSADLTKSLLVYARRDAVTPRAVNVDELLRDTGPLISALAGKGADIVLSLQADGGRIVVDPAQLRQVILNLAGNAMDATRGHGSRVEITTCLDFVDDAVAQRNGALEGGTYVIIAVKDDGRGMDAHTLGRIFEPFFTTKERGKGTGLGLAMCHSIVRRAGGFITVQSELGAGTTCRVHIPLAGAPSRQNDAEILELPPSSSLKPKVLIVEDDAAVRAELAVGIRGLDVIVFAVGTVTEARRILADRAIDVLVTDGGLSDGLGRILARTARAARPSLRAVLVSGTPEAAEEFDATLSKPFTRDALLAAVIPLLPTLPPGA